MNRSEQRQMQTKESLPEYPLRVRTSPPREPFFRRVLPFLSRRRWTIIVTWLLSALLIDGLLHLPKTGFTAAAAILLTPPNASEDAAAPTTVDEGAIWAQTRALRSDALIGEAVDRLDLPHDPAWNYGSASLPPALDGLAAQLEALGLRLRPNTPLRARAAIVERLRHGVRVRRVNASLLVELSVTTPVPSDSVVIANTLADLYVEDRLKGQLASVSRTAAAQQPVFSARVVDRATEADKADSPLGNQALWSALIGLLAGLGFAALVDYMDRGIGGAGQAMKKTGRPVIGSVPLLRGRDIANLPRHRVVDAVISNPMSAYAESLRNLRTSLLYVDQGDPPKLICVTAARHGEGKTTTALALGRVAALAGQRTLIVDCDLRRHALSRMLGLSPQKGIFEAASGEVGWRDAVIRDEPTGADLMLVSESYYRPRDFFSSPAMERLFSEFRDAYDLVILSAPPALAVADARTISRLSDRTILVAHWTRTPSTMLRAAIRLLATTGSDVSGLVLNFVDPRARGRLTETDTAYQAKFATRYYKS